MNQTTNATLDSSTETSENTNLTNRGDGRRVQGEESQLPENFNFCGTVTLEEFSEESQLPENFSFDDLFTSGELPEDFNLEKIIATISYLLNFSEDSNSSEKLGSEFLPISIQSSDFPGNFNSSDQHSRFPKPQNFRNLSTDFLNSDTNFSESINFQDFIEQFYQLELSEVPEYIEYFPTIIDEDSIVDDQEELPDDLEDSIVDDQEELPDDLEDFPTIIDEDSIVDDQEELPDDLEDFPTIIDEDSIVDDQEELPDDLEDSIVDDQEELPDDLEDFPTIIDDEELPEGELSDNAIEYFPNFDGEPLTFPDDFSPSEIDGEFTILPYPLPGFGEEIPTISEGEIDGEFTILPFPLPETGEEFDWLTGSSNGEELSISEGEIDGEVTILPFPLPGDEEFDLLMGSSNGEEFPTLSETDNDIIQLPFEHSLTPISEGGELPEIIPCFVGYDPMTSSSTPLTEEDLTPVI
ncbi:hypothetical protein ACL6C3_03910 [Capilliphycus salinus ALCB114379]|uniref:hypothetical protein n=1 Tax=Capilliphycus salinus TaxID=2768948 RepID=UPI0039A6D84E